MENECCLKRWAQCCCVCRHRVKLMYQNPEPPRDFSQIGWACLVPRDQGEEWVMKIPEHGSCEMWWGVPGWEKKFKEECSKPLENSNTKSIQLE